jgi:hypothetical protein
MSKIKSLRKHAKEILKKNLSITENVINKAQTSWQKQFGNIQNKELEERIERSKDRIARLKKEDHTEDNMIKLLQEIHKLKVFQETLNQPSSKRFNTDPIDENDPNLIIFDMDEEQLSNEDKQSYPNCPSCEGTGYILCPDIPEPIIIKCDKKECMYVKR